MSNEISKKLQYNTFTLESLHRYVTKMDLAPMSAFIYQYRTQGCDQGDNYTVDDWVNMYFVDD